MLLALACAPGASMAGELLSMQPPVYTVTGLLSALPGNPYRTRLYSLRRAAMTHAFWQHLSTRISARPNVSVTYAGGPNVDVHATASDPATALALVKAAIDAFSAEVARRTKADPSYGGLRIVSAPRVAKGDAAESRFALEGMKWTEAEQRANRTQMEAIGRLLTSPRLQQEAAGLACITDSRRDTPARRDEVLRELRSSLTYEVKDDNYIEVRFQTSDERRLAFLGALLAHIPRQPVNLEGVIPEADLDFIQPYLRRDFFIMNCCRYSPR
jgi:hypothetical protein